MNRKEQLSNAINYLEGQFSDVTDVMEEANLNGQYVHVVSSEFAHDDAYLEAKIMFKNEGRQHFDTNILQRLINASEAWEAGEDYVDLNNDYKPLSEEQLEALLIDVVDFVNDGLEEGEDLTNSYLKVKNGQFTTDLM